MTGDVLESRHVHQLRDPLRRHTQKLGLSLADSGGQDASGTGESQAIGQYLMVSHGGLGREVKLGQQLGRNRKEREHSIKPHLLHHWAERERAGSEMGGYHRVLLGNRHVPGGSFRPSAHRVG